MIRICSLLFRDKKGNLLIQVKMADLITMSNTKIVRAVNEQVLILLRTTLRIVFVKQDAFRGLSLGRAFTGMCTTIYSTTLYSTTNHYFIFSNACV